MNNEEQEEKKRETINEYNAEVKEQMFREWYEINKIYLMECFIENFEQEFEEFCKEEYFRVEEK